MLLNPSSGPAESPPALLSTETIRNTALVSLSFYFMAQLVKNLPAMQETGVQSLSWEDHLKEGMATHASILSWRIPWTEEFGGLQSMSLQRVGYD